MGLMKSWFEVKVRARLGPEPSDDKEIVVLGRVVSWKDEGIEYQADLSTGASYSSSSASMRGPRA